MSIKPEGHHCWTQVCQNCGVTNYGCVSWQYRCENCKEFLQFDNIPNLFEKLRPINYDCGQPEYYI